MARPAALLGTRSRLEAQRSGKAAKLCGATAAAAAAGAAAAADGAAVLGSRAALLLTPRRVTAISAAMAELIGSKLSLSDIQIT